MFDSFEELFSTWFVVIAIIAIFSNKRPTKSVDLPEERENSQRQRSAQKEEKTVKQNKEISYQNLEKNNLIKTNQHNHARSNLKKMILFNEILNKRYKF